MMKNNLCICSLLVIFLLSACGGSDDSEKIKVTQNKAPVALIDLEATSIILNNSVTISGAASKDPDGDALSYQWSIKTEKGDDLVLDNSTAEAFVFTPSKFGIYYVSLMVRDSKLSHQVTSTLTVTPNEQSYPVAITSENIKTKIGTINWFNAKNSTAAEGQLLAYSWEIKSKPAGSSSTIGDAHKINAYLIADVAGVYEVLLTVTNIEDQLTNTKTLLLEVDEVLTNSAPVAKISESLPNYGPSQLVKFNGLASYDNDGNDLHYQWEVSKTSTEQTILLVGENTEFVEFYPDGLGEYQINLTVSDGLLNHKATTTITVTDQNLLPVANAGVDQTIPVNTVVTLDGGSSFDADGKAADLTYQWSLVSKPISSSFDDLANPKYTNESKLAFVADVIGDYVLALQVSDGVGYSYKDQVYIEVTENQRPVAVLGNDIVVGVSSNVEVKSTESYDPEAATLTYAWQIIGMPEGSTTQLLSGNDASAVNLSVDIEGTYTIQLVVNDGIHDSLPETINIVYTPNEFFELTVSGQLVNGIGEPLAISSVGGILQKKSASDDNGQFEVILRSRHKDAALKILMFADNDILSTILRIPETDKYQIDLGLIKLPVLQRKDISLTACQGYKGAEKITVYFGLATDGYENMKFIKPIITELTIGQEPKEVKLPANGLINMRIASSQSSHIYVESGDEFFLHDYQQDDTQVDPLSITVCNLAD